MEKDADARLIWTSLCMKYNARKWFQAILKHLKGHKEGRNQDEAGVLDIGRHVPPDGAQRIKCTNFLIYTSQKPNKNNQNDLSLELLVWLVAVKV